VTRQLEKSLHLHPDCFKAPEQLVVVGEHMKLDVRSGRRPSFYRRRFNRGVEAALEDLNRLVEGRLERIVLAGVGVQVVVDRHHPTVAVMKDGELIR